MQAPEMQPGPTAALVPAPEVNHDAVACEDREKMALPATAPPVAGVRVQLEAADENGWTALMRAADSGNADEVRALLAAGASPHTRCAREGPLEGASALFYACLAGRSDVVAVLADAGADVDRTKADGATPLWAAAFSNADEAVSVLLGAGAELSPQYHGMTALQWARHGKRHGVTALLERAEAVRLDHSLNAGATTTQRSPVGATSAEASSSQQRGHARPVSPEPPTVQLCPPAPSPSSPS
jgi:ankyrin repeat protein